MRSGPGHGGRRGYLGDVHGGSWTRSASECPRLGFRSQADHSNVVTNGVDQVAPPRVDLGTPSTGVSASSRQLALSLF
eukprot:3486355-Pyramimonas_sp.AAC.1